MKAILKHKALLAGLVAASVIGTAAAQIRDVEVLADGTILYAADFTGTTPPPTHPSVGAVDWDGNLAWQCAAQLSGPGSAQRLADGSTLIADTGNNRVIEVDAAGFVSQPCPQTAFVSPTDARRLANGNTMIVDSGNHRVIEVNAAGGIVWQFGTTGISGVGPRLYAPSKAERLANGNTLIADTANNRVIEVNAARQIVRGFAAGLNAPHAAVRLANGNTMIADTGNHRVLEYSPQGQLLRTIATGELVYDVERLANGNTLCSGDGSIAEYTPQGQLFRELHVQGGPDQGAY